jgi:hypothetical protein
MTDLTVLKQLAQIIADQTATPRWVAWTTLGWRIEYNEPLFAPSFRFDPRDPKDIK